MINCNPHLSPGVALNHHGHAEKEKRHFPLSNGEVCLLQRENCVMVEPNFWRKCVVGWVSSFNFNLLWGEPRILLDAWFQYSSFYVPGAKTSLLFLRVLIQESGRKYGHSSLVCKYLSWIVAWSLTVADTLEAELVAFLGSEKFSLTLFFQIFIC